MSFKFETITEEISLTVDRQTLKSNGSSFVTPTRLPENFPIDLPEPRHCVLTKRSVSKHDSEISDKEQKFQIQRLCREN